MFSVKPGRGSSWGGAFSAILGIVFLIFWISQAKEIGGDAGNFFPIFGMLLMIGLIGKLIMSFYNATSNNRTSIVDITTDKEESDPLNSYLEKNLVPDENEEFFRQETEVPHNKFCPYCGIGLKSDFNFCPSCGKSLS